MEKFLSFLGLILNVIPETISRGFCRFFGLLLHYLHGSRRKIVLKNLYIAFPDKSEAWRRKLARVNCARWAETVWLFLCASRWHPSRVKKHLSLSPSFKNWIEKLNQQSRATVLLIPHLNLMELMTQVPCLFEKFPRTGIVYRPFKNAALEHWVRKTRERFGIQLLSRKNGLQTLETFLANKGLVGFLFDQSTGDVGCLTTFMGRLASSTPLPGIYAEKFQTDIAVVYVKRTGFCRAELCIEELAVEKKAIPITLAADRWLGKKLRTDATFYENWLWLHRRWKTQEDPKRRFRIEQKRNCLSETCRANGWEQLPKRTDVWIRLPKWLGDCVMTYPVVTALRRARPDFYLHAVVTENLADLVKNHFPVDHVVTLPKHSGLSYFKPFWAIRRHYPDVWINFPNSQRTDLEAFCSGATQRFGIQKKHRRFLLTHTVRMQPEPDEHQVHFWYRFLRNFGLNVPLSKEPFFESKKFTTVTAFGCFVGSANTPSKRWPTGHWRQLIGKLLQTFPNAQCVLLGSASDRPLCETIAESLPPERIQISAGKTDLSTLETQLRTLDFVISADSGGLHLSNALGLPTVALFGFTDPSYSKPFFDAPTLVLQSPTNRMEDLSSEVVFEKVQGWLEGLTVSK
ncbi:MAG: hypothetical protein IJ793_02885 [Opitutales bacterium]|nr:hypothetical protein [Opitutales bacterium]